MPGVLKIEGSQVLTGNGSGVLSWSSGVPAGTIIQVVGKTLKNTDVSETGTFDQSDALSGYKAISGFEIDISPKQTNSDFHVITTASVGGDGNGEGMILLKRGYDASGGTSFTYTDIKGDASGSSTRASYSTYYDFPSYLLVTVTMHVWDSDISYASGGKFRYKLYWNNPNNTTGDLYLNRSAANNNSEKATGISSIIVQEIAGT